MSRTSRPCWSSDSILSMAGRPEAEQGDERGAGLVRPRVARGGHAVGQAVRASPWRWDGPARPRWRPGAAAARRRRRPGPGASGRSHRRPRACRARGRPAPGSGPGRAWPRRKRRFGGGRGVPEAPPPPDVVAHPGDLAAGRRDGRMRASASGKPRAAATWSWSCRRSLSCSRLARRCSSTRIVGEERGRALERSQVGVVGQQRRVGGDGAQHADVAQAAVALLEVGLEQEGDVAGAWRGARPSAPRAGGGTWCPAGRARRPGPSRGAARPPWAHPRPCAPSSRPSATRTSSAAAVEHLGGAADRVVEVHALVPHRVPDGVGDLP